MSGGPVHVLLLQLPVIRRRQGNEADTSQATEYLQSRTAVRSHVTAHEFITSMLSHTPAVGAKAWTTCLASERVRWISLQNNLQASYPQSFPTGLRIIQKSRMQQPVLPRRASNLTTRCYAGKPRTTIPRKRSGRELTTECAKLRW